MLSKLQIIAIVVIVVNCEGWDNQNLWTGQCPTGTRQSPINIAVGETTRCPETIKFKITQEQDSYYLQEKPSVDNAVLKNPYTLSTLSLKNSGKVQIFNSAQFHFHQPSEHTINGERFDLQMHIVHVSQDLLSYAVLGILFRKVDQLDSEDFFDKLNLSTANNINQMFPLQFCSQKVYHYHGSLTTPTCSENVEWFVSAKVMKITANDLLKITNLINSGNPSNRNIQNINGRTVYVLGDQCQHHLDGLCRGQAGDSAKAGGIVLLILAVLGITILKSKLVIYFVLSLQMLGLISLVQSSWSIVLNDILGFTQYLMIFSAAGAYSKKSDGIFTKNNMNRLNQFMRTSSFDKNMPPIAIFILICTVLMILLRILKTKKPQMCEKTFLGIQFFKKAMIALETVYLLTIQQMILMICIAFRFDKQATGGQIVCMTIYFMSLIYFLVVIHLECLPWFVSIPIQIVTLAKRLFLPIMVVISYSEHYLLFTCMLILSLTELILIAHIPFKSNLLKIRNLLHRSSEAAIIIAIGVYWIHNTKQVYSSNQNSPASYFSIILFIWYLLTFLVELVLTAKDRICNKKISEGQIVLPEFASNQKFNQAQDKIVINNGQEADIQLNKERPSIHQERGLGQQSRLQMQGSKKQ